MNQSKKDALIEINSEIINFKNAFGQNNYSISFNNLLPFDQLKKSYKTDSDFNNLIEIQITNLSIGLNKGKFIELRAFSNPCFTGQGICVLVEDK